MARCGPARRHAARPRRGGLGGGERLPRADRTAGPAPGVGTGEGRIGPQRQRRRCRGAARGMDGRRAGRDPRRRAGVGLCRRGGLRLQQARAARGGHAGRGGGGPGGEGWQDHGLRPGGGRSAGRGVRTPAAGAIDRRIRRRGHARGRLPGAAAGRVQRARARQRRPAGWRRTHGARGRQDRPARGHRRAGQRTGPAGPGRDSRAGGRRPAGGAGRTGAAGGAGRHPPATIQKEGSPHGRNRRTHPGRSAAARTTADARRPRGARAGRGRPSRPQCGRGRPGHLPRLRHPRHRRKDAEHRGGRTDRPGDRLGDARRGPGRHRGRARRAPVRSRSGRRADQRPAQGRSQRHRHRPGAHAGRVLRRLPPAYRQQRGGDRQPQPAGLQRVQDRGRRPDAVRRCDHRPLRTHPRQPAARRQCARRPAAARRVGRLHPAHRR